MSGSRFLPSLCALGPLTLVLGSFGCGSARPSDFLILEDVVPEATGQVCDPGWEMAEPWDLCIFLEEGHFELRFNMSLEFESMIEEGEPGCVTEQSLVELRTEFARISVEPEPEFESQDFDELPLAVDCAEPSVLRPGPDAQDYLGKLDATDIAPYGCAFLELFEGLAGENDARLAVYAPFWIWD